MLANQELLKVFLPSLRADFEAVETYQFVQRPKLSCPITAMGGLADKLVPHQDFQKWQEHSFGAFSLCMFPGNHFFLHSEENLVRQKIAEHLWKTKLRSGGIDRDTTLGRKF